MRELMQQPHILQAMANIEEAKHASVFVAGWRPGLGWLCVACLAWAWIIRDFFIMGLTIAGSYISDLDQTKEIINMLPTINAQDLLTLTMALLGLGGLRTYEATKGVKRHKL